MLHNHTYPGEIWMHLLLLATAWNGTWCEMAFCMHFHSNVRLCSYTHLPLGESVFIWPGPFLYSYFILLDKGSEGEEGQSEDRLGHYKPHGFIILKGKILDRINSDRISVSPDLRSAFMVLGRPVISGLIWFEATYEPQYKDATTCVFHPDLVCILILET